MFPSDRVAQLYPQAPDSLFFTSCNNTKDIFEPERDEVNINIEHYITELHDLCMSLVGKVVRSRMLH
jgi:hypothetical protein